MDSFSTLLADMRPMLLRTAQSRLRNTAWAEDAVSETLLAALQRRPDFLTPARVRAWLFGILRHKVVDQLRLHLDGDGARLAHTDELDEAARIPDTCAHANPVQRLADRQFVDALHQQLQSLPRAHADAFLRRECWGQDTADICKELAVTAGNLWVMLHRTRHRLRQGLADHAV